MGSATACSAPAWFTAYRQVIVVRVHAHHRGGVDAKPRPPHPLPDLSLASRKPRCLRARHPNGRCLEPRLECAAIDQQPPQHHSSHRIVEAALPEVRDLLFLELCLGLPALYRYGIGGVGLIGNWFGFVVGALVTQAAIPGALSAGVNVLIASAAFTRPGSCVRTCT